MPFIYLSVFVTTVVKRALGNFAQFWTKVGLNIKCQISHPLLRRSTHINAGASISVHINCSSVRKGRGRIVAQDFT